MATTPTAVDLRTPHARRSDNTLSVFRAPPPSLPPPRFARRARAGGARGGECGGGAAAQPPEYRALVGAGSESAGTGSGSDGEERSERSGRSEDGSDGEEKGLGKGRRRGGEGEERLVGTPSSASLGSVSTFGSAFGSPFGSPGPAPSPPRRPRGGKLLAAMGEAAEGAWPTEPDFVLEGRGESDLCGGREEEDEEKGGQSEEDDDVGVGHVRAPMPPTAPSFDSLDDDEDEEDSVSDNDDHDDDDTDSITSDPSRPHWGLRQRRAAAPSLSTTTTTTTTAATTTTATTTTIGVDDDAFHAPPIPRAPTPPPPAAPHPPPYAAGANLMPGWPFMPLAPVHRTRNVREPGGGLSGVPIFVEEPGRHPRVLVGEKGRLQKIPANKGHVAQALFGGMYAAHFPSDPYAFDVRVEQHRVLLEEREREGGFVGGDGRETLGAIVGGGATRSREAAQQLCDDGVTAVPRGDARCEASEDAGGYASGRSRARRSFGGLGVDAVGVNARSDEGAVPSKEAMARNIADFEGQVRSQGQPDGVVHQPTHARTDEKRTTARQSSSLRRARRTFGNYLWRPGSTAVPKKSRHAADRHSSTANNASADPDLPFSPCDDDPRSASLPSLSAYWRFSGDLSGATRVKSPRTRSFGSGSCKSFAGHGRGFNSRRRVSVEMTPAERVVEPDFLVDKARHASAPVDLPDFLLGRERSPSFASIASVASAVSAASTGRLSLDRNSCKVRQTELTSAASASAPSASAPSSVAKRIQDFEAIEAHSLGELPRGRDSGSLSNDIRNLILNSSRTDDDTISTDSASVGSLPALVRARARVAAAASGSSPVGVTRVSGPVPGRSSRSNRGSSGSLSVSGSHVSPHSHSDDAATGSTGSGSTSQYSGTRHRTRASPVHTLHPARSSRAFSAPSRRRSFGILPRRDGGAFAASSGGRGDAADELPGDGSFPGPSPLRRGQRPPSLARDRRRFSFMRSFGVGGENAELSESHMESSRQGRRSGFLGGVGLPKGRIWRRSRPPVPGTGNGFAVPEEGGQGGGGFVEPPQHDPRRSIAAAFYESSLSDSSASTVSKFMGGSNDGDGTLPQAI